MRIHLATVVGGRVTVLREMLRHYRALGITSFYINVHLVRADDPVREQIEEITGEFGYEIASVTIGDWQKLERGIWRRTMDLHPDDWFVLADQDEFQIYPKPLPEILQECEQAGADYLTGCLIDRLSADGTFPEVDHYRSLWMQFPLGSMITAALQGGSPRKVVAAKGWVNVIQGQHLAVTGVRCPPEKYFIPVHHFKWVHGIVGELERRAHVQYETGVSFWFESRLFVDHVRGREGKIALEEPSFLVAACDADYPYRYPYWDTIVNKYGLHWPECDPEWR